MPGTHQETADSRRRSRVSGRFKGRLTWTDHTAPMTTDNISLAGLLCRVAPPLPRAGADCRVEIDLAEGVGILVKGSVVRADGMDVAVRFREMDDESYTHLRNLVRYSADDADAIDKEQTTPAFDSPF